MRCQDGWILAKFSLSRSIETHKENQLRPQEKYPGDEVEKVCGQHSSILTEKAWYITDILYDEKRDQRRKFIVGESDSQSECRICFILLARVFKKYRQHFRSTCSAALLHCKLKSVVALIATFAPNLPRNKFQCCKLHKTCCEK